MKDLYLIKDLLQEGDYMCKIDLCGEYFTVLINQKYRKYRNLVRVSMPLLQTRPSTSGI